ncbi:MAG: radical SAM protein [Candidatus Paceibacterota bacterium]|jgi:MoaA/NifB/PqqE/SkfB family radical SAM enzyme
MNKLINKILKELSYQTGRYMVSPEYVSLMITGKCNFRCQTCSIWQKKEKKELNEADWLRIAHELSDALKPDTFIEINGGEPLMRPSLTISLVKELKRYFKKVTLNSNGSLINEEILDQLKKAGLGTIKMSFYSLDEKIHNQLRGNSLAYDQAMKTISLITKKQIELEIGLLITSKNIKNAVELVMYLQTLPKTSIILQPLDEKIGLPQSLNRSDNKLITSLWPKRDDIDTFFSWIEKNRQKIKNSSANLEAIRQYYLDPKSTLSFRCFAGQRSLIIQPDGDVLLCFKGKSIGNIKNQSVKKILKNAISERKKIKNCQKYCRIIGCNFSRGLKEML